FLDSQPARSSNRLAPNYPLPLRLSPSLFSNSFPHNLLSDSRPLNPVLSIFYENIAEAGARYFFKSAISGLFHSSPFFPIFYTLFWATSSPQLLCHRVWVPGWVPPFFASGIILTSALAYNGRTLSDQGFIFHTSSILPRLHSVASHRSLFI